MAQTSSGTWYKLQLQRRCCADACPFPGKMRSLVAKAGLTDLKNASPTNKALSCTQFTKKLWVLQKRTVGSMGSMKMVYMCWEFSGLKNTSFCPDVAFFHFNKDETWTFRLPGLGILFFELYAKRSLKTSFIQQVDQKGPQTTKSSLGVVELIPSTHKPGRNKAQPRRAYAYSGDTPSRSELTIVQ